jgi:hypothetical protein
MSVVLPTGHRATLKNSDGLVCGQIETRGNGELIALCEKCVVEGWYENYPVIQKIR